MKKLHKPTTLMLLLTFCSSLLTGITPAMAQTLPIPQAGTMVGLSQPAAHPLLRGVKVDPNNPLRLEFIIDSPNNAKVSKEDFDRLVGYFMAVLTVPEKDFWVNLSPYEQDRVINPVVEQTSFGRELLAQDYLLKQLASSLTHPESTTGKAYWDDLLKSGGVANAFNKVWIVPEKAEIYENGNVAYLTQASLKVLTDADYLATQANSKNPTNPTNSIKSFKKNILPKISEDVNSGENFTQLRQIYCSFLLASWFKSRLKESLYKYYINQNKVQGIELQDKNIKEKIYNQYIEAFKKGAYNYVKKETVGANNHSPVQKITRRQYFSGGVGLGTGAVDADQSTTVVVSDQASLGFLGIKPVAGGDSLRDVMFPGDVDSKGKPGSGTAKKAGADYEEVTREERLRAIALFKAQGESAQTGIVNFNSWTHDVTEIVHDPETAPTKRGFHFKRVKGPWMIVLRQGLSAAMEKYVQQHEKNEIIFGVNEQLAIEDILKYGVAKDAKLSYGRVVHMLVRAQEGADWVAKHKGLMPVDQEDLESYDVATLQQLSAADRSLQRFVIGKFYRNKKDIIRGSAEYEQRFKKAARELALRRVKPIELTGKPLSQALARPSLPEGRWSQEQQILTDEFGAITAQRISVVLDDPRNSYAYTVGDVLHYNGSFAQALRAIMAGRIARVTINVIMQRKSGKDSAPTKLGYILSRGANGGIIINSGIAEHVIWTKEDLDGESASGAKSPARKLIFPQASAQVTTGVVEVSCPGAAADNINHAASSLISAVAMNLTLSNFPLAKKKMEELSEFLRDNPGVKFDNAQAQALAEQLAAIPQARTVLKLLAEDLIVRLQGDITSGAGKVAGTPYVSEGKVKVRTLLSGSPVTFNPQDDGNGLIGLEKKLALQELVNLKAAFKLLRESGYDKPLLQVVMDNANFLAANELSRWVNPVFGVDRVFIVLRPGLSVEEIVWALTHDSEEALVHENRDIDLYLSLKKEFGVDSKQVAHIVQSAKEAIAWIDSGKPGIMPVHEIMLKSKSGDEAYYKGIISDNREQQMAILIKLGFSRADRETYDAYQDRFKARAEEVGGIALETNITLKSGSKAIEIKVTPQQVAMMKSAARVGYNVVTVGEQHPLKELLSL